MVVFIAEVVGSVGVLSMWVGYRFLYTKREKVFKATGEGIRSASALPDGVSITVVVPAYNEENNIVACARAVLESTDLDGSRFQLIVVDDMSKDGTVATKGGILPNHTIDTPWMRAMVLAPSAAHFMSVSLFGAPDYTRLTPMMAKPATAVMMTFSENPHLGMTAERFSGEAVVFVATVTFAPQRSAALQ